DRVPADPAPRDPYGQHPPAPQGHGRPSPPPAAPGYDEYYAAPRPGQGAHDDPAYGRPDHEDRPRPQQPYDERGYRAPDRGCAVPDYDYDYGGADHGEYRRSAPPYPPQQPAYRPAPGDEPPARQDPYQREDPYPARPE